MSYISIAPTGKIDRRGPNDEGDPSMPIERENLISRDKRLVKPQGTAKAIDTALPDIVTWGARYNSIETGVISPKSFVYTQDGQIWVLNELLRTAVSIKAGLNTKAYPKSQLYKTQTQTKMYLVDGKNLFEYDGNNDNKFTLINLGGVIEPLDVCEHRDRLCLLTNATIVLSANLDPTNFSSATDSIEIIVGSGKGKNLAWGKLEDKLYIFNTEGIFILYGDVISALATTFEVRLLEERRIIAGRSAVKVEKAIIFLADDFNIWSWDGSTSQKLSHSEKLEDYVNTYRQQLDKAVATYYNNFYMLSFVEKAQTTNNLEIWWCAFEQKIDFVRGRNVSMYMQTDPNIEQKFMLLGRSDTPKIMRADEGYNWDTTAIPVRLRTRDVTPVPNRNVRFTAFFPKIAPTGTRRILLQYMLDGRQSNLTQVVGWYQSLDGENKILGEIRIKNQDAVQYRVRPLIGYSKGKSIAFVLIDTTIDLTMELRSIVVEYIDRFGKKAEKVGA
jgi:hypothetical protein